MKPKLLFIATSSSTPEFMTEVQELYDVRFGAYATVRVPGRISCGDEIILSGK
jgi:hypothetical protein